MKTSRTPIKHSRQTARVLLNDCDFGGDENPLEKEKSSLNR